MRRTGDILAFVFLCGALLPFAAGCAAPGGSERELGTVMIGFCNGSGPAPAQLAAQHADLIAALDARPGDGKQSFVQWRQPETPQGALPQRPAEARWGYSFERGPLHLTVIETEEPMPENSAAYLWLLNDLSQTSKPWKVAIMQRPIFTFEPTRVERGQVAVADLLSREGVAVAVSPDGAGYCRSARIGMSLSESVHYALLGPAPVSSPDAGGAAAPAAARPDWVARATGSPCYGVLEVRKNRFRWSAFDLQGRRTDLLEFSSAAAATEGKVNATSEAKVFTVSELLAAARAQETGAGDTK